MIMLKKSLWLLLLASALCMWACDGHSAVAKIEDDPNSGKSRVIDPVTGDTIYVEDTVVVYKDTTLRWVGSSALLITEISPLNTDWRDLDGDDGAWVEIYNAGDRSANLKGYSLVESLKAPKKWVFGDELIAAKSLRTVFLDKKDINDVSSLKDGTDEAGNVLRARAHTNWKLDKSGGTLYLIDPSNGIRDSAQYPDISRAGVSWGIVDGGDWKYFGKSTPEARNTESIAYDGFSDNPNFGELKAGFYSAAVTIDPPTVESGATVHCTQNGSLPNEYSPEFTESLKIAKNTVLRCVTYKQGKLPSKVVTKTFFVGETVNMPVVAISVDSAFFRNNYLKGLNCSDPKSCPPGLMEDVEYPVHVEYFENGSSSNAPAWEIEAGISLMGNWSRVYDKKTVAIVMREDYEDGWLHYPLFEMRKGVNDKYKAFNLRNNGNRFVSDYLEDAAGGAILEGSGVDYQRSRQVVVFYNGRYMGIHDMRERYNKSYVETNYGIDANTVNFIKHLGREITASNGTTDNYISMLNYVASNDMSVEANYTTAKTMLDVGNFADYMATEIYSHNGDWPANNVRAWRSPDQPWKFMIYDLDHGYGWQWGTSGFKDETNMFTWIKQGGTSSASCHSNNDPMCFHNLYVNLMNSPSFKRLFINRSAVMLQNYLNGTNFAKTIGAMAATLDAAEVKRDTTKFKQREKYYPGGFSVSGSAMKEWAYKRDAIVHSEYASEFGLSSDIQVTIASSGNGKVLMEGMNLPGSTATSTNYTGTFFGGVQMELTAVPATGATFTGWSDGNPQNPRLVTPTDGAIYTATFK